MTAVSLYDEPLAGRLYSLSPSPVHAGRRLRVLTRFIGQGTEHVQLRLGTLTSGVNLVPAWENLTYGVIHALLISRATPELDEGYRRLCDLTYRIHVNADPELITWLQDLADDFIWDVNDACAAFDNPNLYYPGIDPPLIEPVPDEHVSVVIAALQRELNRERRPPTTAGYGVPLLPPAPLDQLPWHVQRALVERRRYRFAKYGIDRKAFETGQLSIWNIQEDPDWTPRTGAA